MFLTPKHIQFLLASDLERARATFEDSRAEIGAVAPMTNQAWPNPERIRKSNHRVAMDAYALALSDFNDYIIDGIVPARLKASEQRRAAAAGQA